jgi:23S rRNA A2030 N6-methylase RlmJ
VAYLDLVRALNPDGLRFLPGSPAIIAAFLRDIDRLSPHFHGVSTKLRRAFRGDDRIAVHHRDGRGDQGLCPRRGLVFIDPP